MQILILAQATRCKEEQSDFNYEKHYYRLRNRKIAKAVKDLPAHIDCIDNAYTGDPKPYYARVYFGDYDPICFDYDDEHVEHDTEVLFAKESYEGKNYDTRTVPDDTDMFELKEEYEYYNLAYTWLELHKIVGSRVMKNASVTTTGNNVYFSRKEILEIEKTSGSYMDKIYDL